MLAGQLPRGISADLRTADKSSITPAARVQLAAMQIGDFLIHGDRRYLLCGFDPQGVSPRMMYVEDVETGAHSVLPFEDLSLSSTSRGGGLRLVRPSENPRGHVP